MVVINCDSLPVASIGLAGSVVTSWRSCGSCCGIVRRWAATTVILHHNTAMDDYFFHRFHG